jgi:hypothetical protein
MLRRHFAILITTWAFFGMPALCVAGVLEHPCAPDDNHCEKTDTHDCSHEEPDSPHDGGCGHESDCESDPCSTMVVGRERSSDDGPIVSLDAVAIAPCTENSVQALRSTWSPDDVATGNVQLPTHPSDIPLLI